MIELTSSRGLVEGDIDKRPFLPLNRAVDLQLAYIKLIARVFEGYSLLFFFESGQQEENVGKSVQVWQ